MDLSIFISHQRVEPNETFSSNLYVEKLAEAKLADKLGFSCIWVPEHHLIQFMQAPNGLLLATYYGAQVSCPVGQMVNLLLYRHPLVSAGEIALADQLLGGRLQLGLGRGAYNYEFKRLGISWDVAEAKFLECVDVLEKVWASPDRGISYDGHGEYVTNNDLSTGAAPTPFVPLGIRDMENHAVALNLSGFLGDGFWFAGYAGWVGDRYASNGLLAGIDLHYMPQPGMDLALGIRQSTVSYIQGERGSQLSAGLNLTLGVGAPPQPSWMQNAL